MTKKKTLKPVRTAGARSRGRPHFVAVAVHFEVLRLANAQRGPAGVGAPTFCSAGLCCSPGASSGAAAQRMEL